MSGPQPLGTLDVEVFAVAPVPVTRSVGELDFPLNPPLPVAVVSLVPSSGALSVQAVPDAPPVPEVRASEFGAPPLDKPTLDEVIVVVGAPLCDENVFRSVR